jgi:hypothetical protein
MAPQRYQLVVKSGPEPGQAFTLEEDEIQIGREASNDIAINDMEVSRRHARLTRRSGGYAIEDLGSTNGTFVDGVRLTGQRLLQGGETITLGENVSLAYTATPFDPDATLVGAPHLETEVEAPPPVASYPAERYAEPAVESRPYYSGRIPPSPVEPPPQPQVKRRTNTWMIVGCGCLAVILCAAVIGTLFYIDAQNMWCTVFPFLPGC